MLLLERLFKDEMRRILPLIACMLYINSLQTFQLLEELQQNLQYVSDQIELADLSQYLIFEQNNRERLLLEIHPVHAYILSNTADVIAYFSEFYNELVKQLQDNTAAETINFEQYRKTVLDVLIMTLSQAIVQYNYNPSFTQRIPFIVRILQGQKVIMPVPEQHRRVTDLSINSVQFTMPSLRLQEWLIAKQWTLNELAEKSGLSKQTLNNILTKKNSCRMATLQKLAGAFGVNVRDLFARPTASSYKRD